MIQATLLLGVGRVRIVNLFSQRIIKSTKDLSNHSIETLISLWPLQKAKRKGNKKTEPKTDIPCFRTKHERIIPEKRRPKDLDNVVAIRQSRDEPVEDDRQLYVFNPNVIPLRDLSPDLLRKVITVPKDQYGMWEES